MPAAKEELRGVLGESSRGSKTTVFRAGSGSNRAEIEDFHGQPQAWTPPVRWALHPRMGMKSIVAALALFLPITACDIATVPEFAQYDADGSASIDVVIHASAMPAEGVQAVEIEVHNVLLHRSIDDTWVIVGPESLMIELTGVDSELVIEGVPIDNAAYDLVAVEIGRVRVASGDRWKVAELVTDWFELEIQLGGSDSVLMELGFDLEASLSGDAERGWIFDPAVSLEILDE